MKKELTKTYNPGDNEERIYKKWDQSGYFNPDNLNLPENAPSYTIILPPPNITAKLHLGHVVMIAVDDLLIRYHRLKGFRTLWLPGTDHAAIATQNVVEKKLLKETGQTRHDLGRTKFLEEVWSFLRTTQSEIFNQIKSTGASLDWSRVAFTLDEERQLAVKTIFKQMYEEGAIYRGERIVNWCSRCHSTLADDEVEHKEGKTKLYWIKYGPFVLATTRPETKLGDTAVAVYPGDARYEALVGKEIDITGVLGVFKVKVVADKAVEMEFGSGAIKVTPAHSFIDNEIATRHNLPSKKIINEDGRMMDNCGKYAGLTVKEAREEIVKDMEAMGLIDHIDEDYTYNSAHCYRCQTIIEPLPSKQWFVAVDKKIPRLGNKSLKEAAIEVVKKEEIKFTPDRFTKRYLDWMENLHDWCISRQIWFGHQIPVWYKETEIYCGLEKPEGDDWVQDVDTLDTWFSSAMWTFSTLGWPNNYKNEIKTGDLAKYHPSQVLETGYEIITLWVSRIIMISLFAVKEIPFSQVYLHGLILDKDGKKMSKSKGNGVDPLEVAKKFGADAVRLSLLMGSTPGNDMKFSEEKIEAKRNFINKLWNIARFILTQTDDSFIDKPLVIPTLKTDADYWIIESLADAIKTVNSSLGVLNFSAAAESLNDFTWNKLADWYLEAAKIEKNKEEILIYILKNILIIWHPFIPFSTETIWESFNQSLLMVEKWPEEIVINKKNNFTVIQDIVVAIRNARAEHKIEPAKKLKAVIYGGDLSDIIKTNQDLIKNLKTNLDQIEVEAGGEKIDNAITIIVNKIEIYLLGSVDVKKEKERLLKEAQELNKLISLQKNKLNNKEFVDKAPEKIVMIEKNKLINYSEELEKINQTIINL